MTNAFPATMPDLPAGVIIPADLHERDGYATLAALAHRFGWAYAVWDRLTIDDLLTDFDRPMPPQRSTHKERRMTDEEWRRVTATTAWQEGIHRTAYTQVADADVLDDAIYEAGLACAECAAALTDPPSLTGRLCEAHRAGPAGQPAVVNPATEGLYWLDDDTLIYAPIDPDNKAPRKDQGRPVDHNDPDRLARDRARDAETRLRAQIPTTPGSRH